jgi:NitT/TauT family transport system ATP-binding protein
MAPRPTHVLSVETIDMPQAERDPAMIEALHTDLARRFPANFAGM